MRRGRWLAWGVAAAALIGGGAVLWTTLHRGESAEAAYRVGAIDRGDIVSSVRATGTLNPLTTVLVGSQLSGQIVEILADYNSPVKEGQVVARLFADQVRARRDAAAAAVDDLKAQLQQRVAQVDKAKATRTRADANLKDLAAQRDRATAQLADADRTNDRQKSLFERGTGAASAYDTARTQLAVQQAALASVNAQIAAATADLAGLDADISLAKATAESTKAQTAAAESKLKDAEIDLDHTDIRSPVSGVVVQRQIDLGQTVAASFSTPTLFTIAQDLKEIDILANVDESDVGRIKDGQIVKFTVNAYPSRTYQGLVRQIRLGAQTISNVVTYTTVVRVANDDLTLLPGMTANLQIISEERLNVLRVPNAALRFRPAGEAASPATAGAPSAEQSGTGGGGGGRMLTQIRDEMLAELKPTPAQVQAIDEAMAEVRASPTLRDPAMTQDERRAAFRTLRQTMVQRISASLDPERRKSFESMVQRAQATRAQGQSIAGRIYVLDENGAPKAVAVRLGASDGSFTELVRSDFKPGDSVVIGGPRAGSAGPAARPPMGGRGPRLF